MTDNPHFDLPFRFDGHSAAVKEQDTLDDVINCVEVVLLTPAGFRPEAPSVGSPDLTFMLQPIGKDFIHNIIISQEPRAALEVSERPDVFDELIDRINISIDTIGSET